MLGLPLPSNRHDSIRIAQRGGGGFSRRASALFLAVGLLTTGLGLAAPSAHAAPTTMVNLGLASTYGVLSGASVGNTVSVDPGPHTKVRGSLGVKANSQPTGFRPPGLVTGTIEVGNAAAAGAHDALVAAYAEVAGRTGGTALVGDLLGATLAPGLHTNAGAVANTGTVTLDGGGDPNAVFVFKIGGAFTMAAGAKVVLTDGAQASRVFWQVNGAAGIGANAVFAGTLMAKDAVAVGNGTLVNGRAFARDGAISLDANEFYSSPPVVTIAGGLTATTTDTTPTISGTTDVEAPALVTVTVNGQTLTATPSAGAWSVTSAILANDTYQVVASATDAAGNRGTATQALTVDTVLPVVTIDDGPSVMTNDSTPTIAGASDVVPGTVVRVTVGSQTLTALVQSGGTWNITSAALVDGAYTVTASVSDPAGNEGTDSQALTVDTLAPQVTIAGGANSLTNDATPNISGTADVTPGMTVTVTLADETLIGLVQAGGGWSVTASTLSDGPHRVVMSVSDATGNPASYTQTLTVDTVRPSVAISGGASATTYDVTPTIVGTSDAALGSTVTVSIAGQTMTTLLQADGSWNATPSSVGGGTWSVVASVADPAGNIGSATQALTIAVDSGSTGTTGSVEPTSAPVIPVVPIPIVPATLYGSFMSGSTSAGRVVFGGSVTHTSSLKRAGTSVFLGTQIAVLHRRTPGTATWAVVCAPSTSTRGTASCATKPKRNTEYQWKFSGAGSQGSAESTKYVIKVQPRVRAKASATTVSRGSAVTLSGSVAPRHAKQKVYLQRYSRGEWRNVTWKYSSSTSRFSFRLSPTSTFSYRVYKASDADHSWGKSPTRRITVR